MFFRGTKSPPDRHKRSPLTIAALTLTLIAATPAAAEVRIAALSDGRGFDALIAGDLEKASRGLPQSLKGHLTYSDANNLCVMQILTNEEHKAVRSCRSALRKLKAADINRKAKKSLKSELMSNLAVAQMFTGDTSAAQESLSKSLALTKAEDQDSVNARANWDALQARLIASK